LDRPLQDVEPGLAHAIGGGADGAPGGCLETTTLEFAGDNANKTQSGPLIARLKPRLGFAAEAAGSAEPRVYSRIPTRAQSCTRRQRRHARLQRRASLPLVALQ